MFFKILVVIVLAEIPNNIAQHKALRSNFALESPEVEGNSQISENNYNQLVNFIQLLNAQTATPDHADEDDQSPINFVESKERWHQENLREKNTLKGIDMVQLLKKNYDADRKVLEKSKEVNSLKPTYLYIANPELIEEYQNALKKKMPTAASSSSSHMEADDVNWNLKEMLENIRNNFLKYGKNFNVLRRDNQYDIGSKFEKAKPYQIAPYNWENENAKYKPNNKQPTPSHGGFDRGSSGRNSFHPPPRKELSKPRAKTYREEPKSKPKSNYDESRSKPKTSFDDYKVEKHSYKKEDHHLYGRTSIPMIGKKHIYDKK